MAIKEKVKKYIAERNAHEGVAWSGSSDTEASPTSVAEVLGDDNVGRPGDNAAQDGVEN